MADLVSRSSLPLASLVDAEWRFGVTIATDDVGRAGATFVQLKLAIAQPDRDVPRYEHVELSLPQFYSTLAVLEKAASYVAFLSGGNPEPSRLLSS